MDGRRGMVVVEEEVMVEENFLDEGGRHRSTNPRPPPRHFCVTIENVATCLRHLMH